MPGLGCSRVICELQMPGFTAVVGGISATETTAVDGATVWNDRDYVLSSFPATMEGAVLFQGPHKTIPMGTVVSITVSGPATLYVAFEAGGSDRSGGFGGTLEPNGWIDTGQTVTWQGYETHTVSGGSNYNTGTLSLWSMEVNGGTTTLPATTTSETVMSLAAQAHVEGTAKPRVLA